MYLSPLESKGIYRILFAVLAGVDDDYLEKQYPNIDFEDFYTLFIKSTNISLFSACSRFKRSIVLAASVEEVAGYYIDWLDQISGKVSNLNPLLMRDSQSLSDIKEELFKRATDVMVELARTFYTVFPTTIGWSPVINLFCPEFKRKHLSVKRLERCDELFPGGYYPSSIDDLRNISYDSELLDFLMKYRSVEDTTPVLRKLHLCKPIYNRVHFVVDGENFTAGEIESYISCQLLIGHGVEVEMTVFVDQRTKQYWEFFAEKSPVKVTITPIRRILSYKSRVDFALINKAQELFYSHPEDFIYVISSDSDMSILTSTIPATNLGFVMRSGSVSLKWRNEARDMNYFCHTSDASMNLYNKALFLMDYVNAKGRERFGDEYVSMEKWRALIDELGLRELHRWPIITRLRLQEGLKPIPVFKESL